MDISKSIALRILREIQETPPFKVRVDIKEQDVLVKSRKYGKHKKTFKVGVHKIETHKIDFLRIAREDKDILSAMTGLVDDPDTREYLSKIFSENESKVRGFEENLDPYLRKHTSPDIFYCNRNVVCFRSEFGSLLIVTEYIFKPITSNLSIEDR